MVAAAALLALLHPAPVWGGEIQGTLTAAADGSPVVDAVVTAYDLRLDGEATRSRADGGYTLQDLPAGRYRVLARPDDPDNLLSRFYPDHPDFCDSPLVEVAADGAADVDLALPRGGELSGVLTDGDGAALSGLDVVARSVDGTETETAFERIAQTGADGDFTLRGLDAGPWAVEVQGDLVPTQYLGDTYAAEAATLHTVALGEETAVGEHALRPGVVLGGGVFGPEGPAVGARVIVYSGGQSRAVTTDEGGLYAAPGMPPGDGLVWSQPEGLALTYLPDAPAPEEVVVTSAEGEVVEDADLFPPLGAALEVSVVDADSGALIPGVSASLYNETLTVVRGSPGPEGIATFEGLHPGTYRLYVFAADEGYTNGWILDDGGADRLFEVPGAELVAAEVPLPRAGLIEGVVTDDDGAPVYGALVTASTDLDAATATTDREGRYRIGGLSAGTWALSASYTVYCGADPGWVTVYWPVRSTSTTRRPSPWARPRRARRTS